MKELCSVKKCICGLAIIGAVLYCMGFYLVYAAESKMFYCGQNRVLSGVYQEETIYFQVPEYWRVNRAEANIYAELSSMLTDVPASLTFSVNGVPVDSVPMNYINGSRQNLTVNIPTRLINTGYNSLTITGFAQIYDDDGCLDEFSGANWVVIDGESFIMIDYDLSGIDGAVERYPYQLISDTNENGNGLSVVVFDNAGSDELTAAAIIKAGLVKSLEDSDEIDLKYYSKYESSQSSAVILSLYNDGSPDYLKDVMERNGVLETDIENSAAIIIENGDDGQWRVFIVSKNPSCLTEAAWFLMDDSRKSQEKGNVAFVNAESSKELKEGTEILQGETIELSELLGGSSGIELRGAFRREYIVYPPDDTTYIIGPDDTFNFNFRYSENLDFRRSLFTVYVNNKPVASKRLQKEYAGGDNIEFVIPDDLTGEPLESITFSFDLEIEDLYCTVRLDEMPWAFISGNSSFSFNGPRSMFLSFEVTPWPFIKEGFADNMVFVMPNSPSDDELNLLGVLAGMYGRGMRPYGDFSVIKASELSNDVSENSNIVVLGNFNNQDILSSVSGSLPFSIDVEDGKFNGNEMFAFSDEYSKTVAAMQLIPSVYNNSKAMLVVAAPNDDVIKSLTEYLRNFSNQDGLNGDTVIIDLYDKMRYFDFQEEYIGNQKPTLRERIEKNRESVVFSLVGTSAMLLLLIASILILIRVKFADRKK